MPLDWDIKLDTVSIKDEIVSFNIRESKGSYVRELTLFSADPDFYDQFAYTDLPTARVEVLTKITTTWVSQGVFFIEKPVLIVNTDSTTSPGVWGRSETAKVGPPFASKVSKYYDTDTTFEDIINEMADLCGITITSEIDNYTIFANTYVIDNRYPIDVIVELADFAAGYIVPTNSGELLIKDNIFHPSAADHTFTDVDIADISENIDLPDFGNRIKISAMGGLGSGYSVVLEALDDSDCLPADGVSKGTILAFVTDAENNPAADNTIVTWEIESGATLEYEHTGTGNYLLENRKHEATNYYNVSVDFPIVDVIGVWAYSDSHNSNNFWDESEEGASFEGNTITVHAPFKFCDQLLRIAYITGSCAVNYVTAGSNTLDVEVTADVEGAQDSIDIKLGNTCACGSSLNAKVNPDGAICIGNLAHVLVWATINNAPAVGQKVQIRITEGCGELSSENKTLKVAQLLNETSYARNTVSGVTQVQCEIDPASTENPKVYLLSDTAKASNLYSSHDGKLIDLSTILSTGDEVVIDYYADGATLVSWRTLGVTKDCDSEVTITMADGTEAGLRTVVNLNAKDCTISEDIPEYDDDYSDYDPSYDDQDGDEGGFTDDGNDEGGGISEGPFLDDCDVAILNRIVNIDNATTEDESDAARFGTGSSANCPAPEEDWGCPCSDLCDSEIHEKGATYDSESTIHEIVSETYEKGTPEYTEAFEIEKQSQLDACSEKCENAREALCGDCTITTDPVDLVLAPGDSMEISCADGTTELIEMPEGACGLVSFTVGCCTFDVRSTDGHWVVVSTDYITYPGAGCPVSPQQCAVDEIVEGGTRIVANFRCVDPNCVEGLGGQVPDCAASCVIPGWENCGALNTPAIPIVCSVYAWECF